MDFPKITALATALPSRCVTQDEIYQKMLFPHLSTNPLAERIFARTGISSRHLAVEASYYDRPRSTLERNQRYLSEALDLGKAAVQHCLDQAGLSPQDVDDFIIVSCTGIDTPGLDLRLAGSLGMRSDLTRSTILGMGCYAAFPGLARARQAASPIRNSLLLAVEICSLHFQTQDDSTENVVSSALFADGAAAALLQAGANLPGPQIIDAATHCDYQTFDHMAFQLTDQGFRMSLSAYVPELLAAQVETFVDRLLANNDLDRSQIQHWGVHPGSLKILEHVEERLNLAPEALDCSREVLDRYGNMSSPTILFVLDRIQQKARPEPGDYGVIMAFGPGLTMESALLQW